ncbi:MAG: 4Fe-4S dicluster domain-containing protein [Planctomycetota bacterium]
MKAVATKSLDAWLRLLAGDAAVFVPQRRGGGDVVLAPIGEAARTADYIRLAESPKRILMPQADELVRFEGGRATASLDETPRILFGLRPCDAAAIAILDEFFSRDLADPNYLARRGRMRLIVSACAGSEETCFCLSAGAGPVAVDGFDVQLFDLGELQLAQAGSDAGEKMIARGGEMFGPAPPDADSRLAQFRRRAEASQHTRLDLHRVRQIIRDRAEPPEFWESVAARCLMCGGCAYLCPTCTCYDVADRPAGEGEGVRRRLWDTCVLSGFTREASGHNPRERHSARCAFRYLHKLGDSDLERPPFRCVGCGRCAEGCLTRLGIIKVVRELLSASEGDTAKKAGGSR